MTQRRFPAVVLVVGLVLMAAPAAAQQGEWHGAAGLVILDLDSESDALAGTGTTVRSRASVAPSLAYGRGLNEWLSVEASVQAIRLELTSRGGEYPDLAIADLWSLYGTVDLRFHLNTYSKFRPWVGAGAAWMWGAVDEVASDADALGVQAVVTDPAVGWTAAAGVTWESSPRWLWRVDVRWIDVELEYGLEGARGETIFVPEPAAPIDPMTVFLGGQWRF